METTPLKRKDGTQFGFVANDISFSNLCDCISKFPGVTFARRRRFFWWYGNIHAEFVFKGDTFKIDPDPWDDGFWVAPKDKSATFSEIEGIRCHVEEHGKPSRGLLGNPA